MVWNQGQSDYAHAIECLFSNGPGANYVLGVEFTGRIIGEPGHHCHIVPALLEGFSEFTRFGDWLRVIVLRENEDVQTIQVSSV